MIAKKVGKSTGVKAILVGFLILFITAIVALSSVAGQESKLANKIYPNVYLDNTHIGHLSKKEAYSSYKKMNDQLKKAQIHVLYKKESIATLSGSLLEIRSDAEEVIDRAYLIGRTPNTGTRLYQKLSTLLGLGKFQFYSTLQYDRSKVDELISTWEDSYNKPAKDALFQFENGRVTSFRQEEKGLRILSKKIQDDLESAVGELRKNPVKNQIIVLADEEVQPETTLAKANNFGIEELIAVGKSDFSGSIPGRIHNVTLSASKFNGVIIEKGGEISFNRIVGDISALTGYQQAYIIKNGRTVLGDGGGVCQTSSTLFRAALNAGLPIVERTPHAYRVGYYENDSKPGLDATVYSPTVDLKIKNNTPASILIQTEIIGNELYFRFYGKKDDRKVEMTTPVLTDIAPPPEPLHQDDPTLKKGVVKQVDFAAWGGKASFHYKVTSSNPDINFEKTFYSNYRPWQAVFLVGQAD